MAVHRRYGEPFTVGSPGFGTSVVFSSPELVKPIVTGDPQVFHAGLANAPIRPVLGPWSLLALDRAPHMQQRKLLLPPFHGERLRSYAGLIARAGRARGRELAGRRRRSALHERMERLTLEVILDVVFGIADEARKDELRRLLPLLRAEQPHARLLGRGAAPRRRADPTARDVRERGAARSTRCCTPRSPSGARCRRRARAQRNDILSMLVEAEHEDGTPMGDAEIRDQLATLVLAGHETTATALTWAVDLLQRNPAVLRAPARRATTTTYLDAVVREVLRIRPVVPVVGRTVTEPVRIGDARHPGRHRPRRRDDRHAPPRGRLPGAVALPARALPAGADEVPSYALAAVRRRRAPLHRRELRAVRDGDDPARARAQRRCGSRCAGPSRSARPA